jgi:methionine-rich copper-binding protein CopC
MLQRLKPLVSPAPFLLSLAVAGGLFLAPAGGASAHADYDHSTPAENEVVAESPEVVDVYFKEEMARSGGLPTLIVVNESGDPLSSESVLDDNDRTHISVELPPSLPDGQYTVIWHSISDADGDEAQGAFHFYVGEGPGETPAPDGTGNATPAPTTSPAGGDEGGDSGVSVLILIIGVAAGLVVGGGAGIALGRRGGG